MEALKPRGAVEIFNNGVLLADSGFTHSAVLEFQAALKLGMDSLPVYEKLAAVSIKRRNRTKAEMYCKLCCRLSRISTSEETGWANLLSIRSLFWPAGLGDT
jgi:hypothetical protein